jgi:mannose-1-phosphate guanylyltransferase
MADHGGRARALILAGGVGSRLRPLTDALPKCLVPIGGRPLLDYWVEALIAAGVAEARINTHAHADRVRAYIESVNARGRLRLAESHEPELLGSAGTIAANADLADGADRVLIIYADNLSDVDLRALLTFHGRHADPMTMMLFRAADPRACGIVELDAEGRVISFVEKPERPASDLANSGLYVADSAAYREIAAMRAFDIGLEVLPRFVGRMRGWAWGGYHRDIGTHEALEQARRGAGEVFPDRTGPAHAGRRPAVFFDRDGTLIDHVHYLSDPALVRLVPGAAGALRRLRRAGFARVLVTNQSAIGRGMLTAERLEEIHGELERQLAASGATLDAIYYCPEAPAGDDRTVVECHDRKPGPGMLIRAAADLGLDLAGSWMIGDLISDVLAGLNAGCRSILLRSGQGGAAEATGPDGQYECADAVADAVGLILDDRGPHGRGPG